MARAKNLRVRVLLAKDPLDPVPYVVGGVDEKTYDVLTDEDWQMVMANYLTAQWVARGWETREVWLTVSTDRLLQVFEPKPIAAEVEA